MAALLTEPDLGPVAREAARLAGRPDLVVVERGAAYDELLAGASAGRPAVGERTGDDLYLLYTGGTTGSPKGVMWRQHDIYMASFGGKGTPNRGIPPVVRPARGRRAGGRRLGGATPAAAVPADARCRGVGGLAVAARRWRGHHRLRPAPRPGRGPASRPGVRRRPRDGGGRRRGPTVGRCPGCGARRRSHDPAAASTPADRLGWGGALSRGEGPAALPAARHRHPRQLRVVGDREPGPPPSGGRRRGAGAGGRRRHHRARPADRR